MDDNDPLDAYGLCRIDLAHRATFETFFSYSRPQLSDYTFANTFIWRDCIHLRWQTLHDDLCVFANGDGGLSMLFPPIGPGNFSAALRDGMEICRAFNARVGVGDEPRVEYVNESLLAGFAGAGRVEPMSGDYVYATRRMIDLEGPDLSSKRRGRRQFLRDNAAVRVETFGPQHLSQCLALLRTWDAQTEEGSPGGAATSVHLKRTKEVAATVNALTHADALGLTGMVVYAGDRLVGFTLGEMLQDGMTCSILVEKTDRNYRGSANFIFSEFCARHWAHTTWCNAGDDWEVPSLGWTKQSYRPALRLSKWVAWPQPPVLVGLTPAAVPAEHAARHVRDLDRAALTDLNDLLALEAHCFGPKELFSRRQLRYLLRCPRATTYLVREDGQVVAAAIILRRRSAGGVSARLYSMAVDPDRRRRGYGRMLLRNCLDTLTAEGVASVCLEVNDDNAPAISLYEKMGFRVVRRLADYYGRGEHAIKMRMILDVKRPLFAGEPLTVDGA